MMAFERGERYGARERNSQMAGGVGARDCCNRDSLIGQSNNVRCHPCRCSIDTKPCRAERLEGK